jgi:hypothetical protein
LNEISIINLSSKRRKPFLHQNGHLSQGALFHVAPVMIGRASICSLVAASLTEDVFDDVSNLVDHCGDKLNSLRHAKPDLHGI